MSIVEKYDKTRAGFWAYLDEAGELKDIFMNHYAKSYESGLFDEKTKRLMAMVGAIAAGCEGCMLGQCTRALNLGATRAEVLECCAIAFSLGGTMAGSKISLIMQLLDEKGIK